MYKDIDLYPVNLSSKEFKISKEYKLLSINRPDDHKRRISSNQFILKYIFDTLL